MVQECYSSRFGFNSFVALGRHKIGKQRERKANSLVKLEAYFSQATIFNGMQLLLAEQLVHVDHSSWLLSGEFKSDNKHGGLESGKCIELIDTQLDWTAGPIVGSEHSRCSCVQQTPCEHLAALAIDYIAKQDAITPYPSEKKRADTAIRLLKTEFNQRFDPYPNMARHRIVYLLSLSNEGVLHLTAHKGYISKKGRYSIKRDMGFAFSAKSAQPKYITQADLYLLAELKALSLTLDEQQKAAQQEAISLDIQALSTLTFIKTLCATQRCFWMDCEQVPLTIETQYPYDFFDPDAFIAIDERAYLDLASMSLVLLPTEGLDKPVVNNDIDWSPSLTIRRHQIEFSWSEQAELAVEVANFSLVHAEQSISLDEIFSCAYDASDVMKQTAELNVQLADFPLLTSAFESPVWDMFPIGTRILPPLLSEQMILLRRLSLAGWQINYGLKNRFELIHAERWYGDVQSRGDDKSWFDLEIGVEVNGEKVNLLPYLVKAIRQGGVEELDSQSLFLMDLDSGERLALPAARIKKILTVLVELYDKKPLSLDDTVSLPLHQLTRVAELSSIKVGGEFEWLGSDSLRKKAEKIYAYLDKSGTKAHFTKPPKGLNAQLREYQQEGVNWLQFLMKQGFSGILADDMGLGKTIQTLASILIEKESGRLTKPCFIVAPTSLLANWLHEAQSFVPDLAVLLWSGTKRHKNAEQIDQADIVITSYGTLQQDALFWADTHFHLVVLDEAQNIKNARSRIARVVGSLSSSHKLCLTGTPLENHLGELWSQFNFLMPGFLGSAAQFNRLYQTPIEKEEDEEVRGALVRRINPFLLRRMKADVAKELPEKTVINEYISLTQVQGDLYETIRLTMSEELRKAVSLSGMKRNRLAISNALLKLRQVCCHPDLLKITQIADRTDEEGQRVEHLVANSSMNVRQKLVAKMENQSPNSTGVTHSGKLNWLADKLPGMLEDGRRILIFSSFTSMLTLISELLESLSIPHVELTGKSRDRANLVNRFQNCEVPVFLISLKAGGAGLNLTAADVVIHTDPWWNPAAEQQASDRAYRIGQDKSVFVYKLICKDTVEERIQRLQESKYNLAQSIYDSETQHLTEMTGDDWLELLKPLAIDE
ncbi:DEAD/DEAH box helicase [Shewanella woodyi]|uniref:DEAD/DEAH box helicase n=1 Tax=Shewanella woodyi TaxID=60961 RepID=UPI0007EA4742|nr:DEAD/DEAH box helicase [Shewanella woodyi]